MEHIENIRDPQLEKKIARLIVLRAVDIIFSTNGTFSSEISKADDISKSVTLPIFKFDLQTRIEAVQLLKDKSTNPLWGAKERSRIYRSMVILINTALEDKIENIHPLHVPDDVSLWLIENQKILDTLK